MNFSFLSVKEKTDAGAFYRISFFTQRFLMFFSFVHSRVCVLLLLHICILYRKKEGNIFIDSYTRKWGDKAILLHTTVRIYMVRCQRLGKAS